MRSAKTDQNWVDAPTDPSLRWAHSHIVGFVVSWLICTVFAANTLSQLTKVFCDCCGHRSHLLQSLLSMIVSFCFYFLQLP